MPLEPTSTKLTALDRAINSLPNSASSDAIINRAKDFENYLNGETK